MAAVTLRLTEDFDHLLTTVLIGNNIVNIAASAAGTVLFIRLYGSCGATVSTLVLTAVVLVFGEVTPKCVVREYPERFAIVAAPVLLVLKWLCWPLNFLFALWKTLLARILKLGDGLRMSQEELLLLVDEVQSDGVIDRDEGVLLRNAIKFTECQVEEIITPRVDVAAVPAEASRREVADKFLSTKFSRLLVYSGSMDNIVGIVVLRDFFGESDNGDWKLSRVMTPPFFIQKTEKIDDVLKKMQQCRSQLAVVIDEFGGTLGIVSMEDIIEELVGEIWDEHDEVVEKFKSLGDEVFSVDCTVTLDDFGEFFDFRPDSSEPMLGGWVLEQLGKIPQNGDSFTVGELEIEVLQCSRRRVRRVRVRHTPPSAAAGQ